MEISTHQIRIYIIDPQPLIAAALHHLFAANSSFDVIGTAQRVDGQVLQAISPDAILLCQEHGATGLADMVSACRTAAPSANVCVVACHAHPELLARVVEAGADGFTTKDTPPSELIDAVIAIHHGSVYVDPRVGTHSVERGSSSRRIRTLNGLSARETEVLRLIADGYSNREISIALSLSEKTIKNHISRIFAKLHITARTQAVIHAIKNGIA